MINRLDAHFGWKPRDETARLVPRNCERILETKPPQHGPPPPRPPEFTTIVRLRMQVNVLERQLKQKEREVSRTATNLLKHAVHVTTSIFGEDVKISESFDPEFPSDTCIVLSVSPQMTIKEAVIAEQRWAREVRDGDYGLESVRLLIIPS